MDYLRFVQEVVAQAAADADIATEAYIEIGNNTNIQVDRQQVEKLSYSGSKGLGIRVLQDGKMGYAYTSNFSDESVRETIAAAHGLMRVNDEDHHRMLPAPQPVSAEDLAIFNEQVANVHVDEKIAFALQVEQACLDYSERVAMTNRCTYLDGVQHVYLANSRGFAGDYAKSYAACFLMAIGRDGGEQTQAFGLGAGVSMADLDAEAIGRKAGYRATSLLGGKPVPSQTATVVLDQIVTAQLLMALGQALNAQAMQRGRSYLADKMGQEIGSDMVTILDNGRLKGGLGSAPFDAEGVPTQATRLVDEGILQAVIYDTYTANRAGTKSTGNATRGSHRTPPTLGPANFYLQPGHLSAEEIIADVEDGFYVLNAMNTGGINPVAGEFSTAASGVWIENGKLTYPVNEVTIAAPLTELLHNISAVGNDLVFIPFFGSVGAPTIRVDKMTIGGRG